MAEESYGFTTARARLEEIVSQVRKKDTSLEKSLDLLEEGVRLANICTEQIDHADWSADAVPAAIDDEAATVAEGGGVGSDEDAEEIAVLVEDVLVVDESGDVVAEVVEVTALEVVEDAVDRDFATADDAWAEEESVGEPSEPSWDDAEHV